MRLLYGLTIFASAFLLFQVQPIIAKIILPWLGGAAAVWSVCLLFFQAVLLLGYLYAHLLTNKFRPPMQGRIHVALLAISFLALPILPKAAWKPTGFEDPAFRVLLLLSVSVGLPYFVLSSTSPLLQAWYARIGSGASPYRFYALSNTGSMLALLSYPVLVEPKLSSANQALGWSGAYAAVAVLCGAVSLLPRREIFPDQPLELSGPDWKTQTLWVVLAACGSALLLAITNHISQNIAAVPFLWVIPMSLYLITFVLCFAGHTWYRRGLFLRLFGLALAGMAFALSPTSPNIRLPLLISLFCAGLFICCMVCHGELARLKPDPAHVTLFYLMCSLGGALGAMFVAVLAPRVFSGYYELPIALGGCAILVLVVVHRDPSSVVYKGRWQPAWLVLVALAVALVTSLYLTARQPAAHTHLMVRNFYGVLRVADLTAPGVVLVRGKREQALNDDPRYRDLMNGTIDHGLQFLAPSRRRKPTSYYSQRSGIGIALKMLAERGPLRVGVIGLGTGTLAVYGRPDDHYSFYEINPLVVQIANQEFSFLRDCPSKIDLVMGDARLSLERQPPQNFDILVVDAFSGDSIPVHLLTHEAFTLYFRQLKPEGILAVHVSNRYLNLVPVVAAAAASLYKKALSIDNGPDTQQGIYRATWVLVGNAEGSVAERQINVAGTLLAGTSSERLWTDNYTSLLPLLK